MMIVIDITIAITESENDECLEIIWQVSQFSIFCLGVSGPLGCV